MSDSQTAGVPVRVILVRPEQPRNVGAVVRAAANFGAESVRLVGASWTEEDERLARVASASAWDVVGGVLHHASLEEAADGCQSLAGTSARSRQGAGQSIIPAEFFSHQTCRSALVGVVFGPESQGLTAAELARCHVWLQFPTRQEFPSLNLAQAVLLTLYDASKAFEQDNKKSNGALEAEPAGEIALQEIFLGRLEKRLQTCASRRQADPKLMIGQLRRLLHRAHPTAGDLALLNNLLSELAPQKSKGPNL